MIANIKTILASERRQKSKLPRVLWWTRALVTVGLAWYLVNQIRGDIDFLKLQIANPWYLLLAFASAVTAVLCSVWVWQMMLPGADRPGYFTLLAHYLLGFLYQNFLPAGFGGDVVRTGALVQGGQQLIQAANSVLLARLTGLWSIVLLACLFVPFYALETGWSSALPIVLGALGALALAIAGSAILFGVPKNLWENFLPERLRTWHNELRAYLGQPKLLLNALLVSIFIQVLAVSVNASIARTLGLPISFGILLLSIPLVNLVVLLPISIGGFGVREGAYYYLLSKFGVNAGQAVLLSLAVYLLLVLVASIGAAVSQFWLQDHKGGEQCVS